MTVFVTAGIVRSCVAAGVLMTRRVRIFVIAGIVRSCVEAGLVNNAAGDLFRHSRDCFDSSPCWRVNHAASFKLSDSWDCTLCCTGREFSRGDVLQFLITAGIVRSCVAAGSLDDAGE